MIKMFASPHIHRYKHKDIPPNPPGKNKRKKDKIKKRKKKLKKGERKVKGRKTF